MKKTALLLLIVFVLVMLSSCSKMEIDKNAIINSLYIYNKDNNLNFQFNTIKNENKSVLSKYQTTAKNIEDAKNKLENTSVSNIFFGQLQNVIIAKNVSFDEVMNCIEYFYSGYECSPGCNLLFATEEAVDYIIKEETTATRINELAKLIKEDNNDISHNIYTFYNNVIEKSISNTKVPILVMKNQLDVKALNFMNIDEEL